MNPRTKESLEKDCSADAPGRAQWFARILFFVLMLYMFLASIQLFSTSVKIAGGETAERLFSGLENPFVGLAVGILATVLWQSSSATTSMIVALVASGDLSVAESIPIVMGANVGTSITNTLVSLGHVTKGEEFRRAFAGATVHDIFNLLAVAILLPIELITRSLFDGVGVLQRSAGWIVTQMNFNVAGGEFHSPMKAAVKWFAKLIESFFHEVLGIPKGPWLAGVLFVVAIAMLILALIAITKNMKLLMADRVEQWLNRVLKRSGLLGLGIGVVITAIVQSSSITTSLLVPMFGAGLLTLESGFPIMLGANIGTTVTAIMAATVTGPAGLTIAVVHLLFNLCGTMIFFPFRFMRRIPIAIAETLAAYACRGRIWVAALYIVGVFVVAPLLGIVIWKS